MIAINVWNVERASINAIRSCLLFLLRFSVLRVDLTLFEIVQRFLLFFSWFKQLNKLDLK